MNADKNMKFFFQGEPPGIRSNSIRWLQKKVMKKALELPHEFNTKDEWETFRGKIRSELPKVIGIPEFPRLKESYVRARIKVGKDVICERVDVYVDEDYSIPSFVFSPAEHQNRSLPAFVWNPGWPEDKWKTAYQLFAVRMAKQGYVALIPDHAPFGESAFDIAAYKADMTPMTLVMSAGNILGISQLALRTAETIRAGEYLMSRPDVNQSRVAVAGICQGGQDTWLSAAMDERFCAAAPFHSETTFAIQIAEMASYTQHSDASPFPFGILNVCDIEHLHACIAPRPLLVRANLPDNWWPISGFDNVESFTRRIYRLYNSEHKVDFAAEVHEHNLTGPFADALEDFLIKYV